MQGTPKAIEMKGIVRNATVIGAQDGQAEDLINLRFMDGSWRASGDGRLVHTMSGTQYTQLYVHTNVYHHLLGVNNGTLYWFADIENDGVTFYPLDGTTNRTAWPQDMQSLPTAPVALTTVVGDIWITQTGHLLTIIDENDGFEYVIYKTGEKSYRGVDMDENGDASVRSIYPYGQVHFNLQTDDTDEYIYEEIDQEQYIVANNGINHSSSTACIPPENATAQQIDAACEIWHSHMLSVYNKAAEKNRFTDPFFVLVAIKLYDGSYAFASNPILINPREKVGRSDINSKGNRINEEPSVSPQYGNYYGTSIGAIKIIDSTTTDYDVSIPIFTGGASGRHTKYFGSGIGEHHSYANGYLRSSVRGADIVLSIDDITRILNNEETFSGIGIFITRPSSIFDMSAEAYKDGSISLNVDTRIGDDGLFKTIIANAIYNPSERDEIKIIHDLVHSPFYLLREYETVELNTLLANPVIDLSAPEYEGLLLNIVQQKTLDAEAFTRTTYLPKVSYMYNGRLHIANYKSYPFFGYPIDLFHLHNHSVKVQANSWFKGVLPNLTGNNDDYLQYSKEQVEIKDAATMGDSGALINAAAPYFIVKVFIDTAQGEQIVTRYIPAYNPSTPANGRADFVEDLNPLLTYPDARAKKMQIYYVDHYSAGTQFLSEGYFLKRKEFTLKPHPYLNMAYYIDPELKPIKLSDFDNWPVVQPM